MNNLMIDISGEESASDAERVRQAGVCVISQAALEQSAVHITMAKSSPNTQALQLLIAARKSAQSAGVPASLCPTAQAALDAFSSICFEEALS